MTIGLATEKNHKECVAILAKAAIRPPKDPVRLATLDSLSLKGVTPSGQAMKRGHPECLGVLAKSGADLRRSFSWYFTIHESSMVDPLTDVQPQANMLQAVLSFTTLECARCKKFSTDVLQVCSRCRLAHYCSRECQKSDWKFHKVCCKRLRKGQDMVAETARILTEPRPEPCGFDLPFGGNDFVSQAEDDDDTDALQREERTVWEYNTGSRDCPDWKRYPTRIEECLEDMLQLGGPRYMYRPGNSELDGTWQREKSAKPPRNVATNYVYYHDMLERDYYLGTIRAVRRNGTRKPPTPQSPGFFNNKKGIVDGLLFSKY
jgi:hypothetical protein